MTSRDDMRHDDAVLYRAHIVKHYPAHVDWAGNYREARTYTEVHGPHRYTNAPQTWVNKAKKDPDTVSAVVQRGVTVWEDIA